MAYLLQNCSNNLNQVAKRANENGKIYSADLADLRTDVYKRQGYRLWRGRDQGGAGGKGEAPTVPEKAGQRAALPVAGGHSGKNGRGDVYKRQRRANAYKILEDTLNLRDSRVYDTIEEDGKEKRVLNQNETTLAQQKQQAIKDAFAGWVWKDPQRRALLVKKYNELFNSTRPREYDGSHIRCV